MKQPDRQRILQAAGMTRGETLITLDTVDSTNLLAKKLAAAGAGHGTAVVAQTQTAGRGRLGRSFLSPEGGIYLSVILRLRADIKQQMSLTAHLAVAACDAVEEATGFRPQVKWLNDLVAGKKKLAGILAETVPGKDGAVEAVVCGIGINCAAPASAFSPEVRGIATDLLAVTGTEPDRDLLTGLLIRNILRVCEEGSPKSLMARYRKDCITVGREVRVVRGDDTFTATACAVEDDGALIVITESGERQRVFSGEVSVRGMYGYI